MAVRHAPTDHTDLILAAVPITIDGSFPMKTDAEPFTLHT